MENEVIYYSEFCKNVTALVVFENNSQYEVLKPLFEVNGFGFMIPGKDFIVIDGEKMTDMNLLKWVEAHEISHILLKHTNEHDADDEIQADLAAYILLNQFSYNESCEMIINYFNQRHGIELPFERLNEISKKLGLEDIH